MNKETFKTGVAILALLVAGVALYFATGSGNFAGTGHLQKESFQQGLWAGQSRQLNVANDGSITTSATLTSTGPSYFGALLRLDAGENHSYVNSTSTNKATYTLTQADILDYESVLMTATTNITLTLPATSTLTALVPNAGDWQDQCWVAKTSNITFAAGTGIDLESASSTPSDVTIQAGNSGCLRYIRNAATDVIVRLVETNDAD